MVTIHNSAKTLLEGGNLSIGVGLRQARTVDIGKAMKTAGFDWLFIDMEHNTMDIDTACQISVAAQDAGITPIVRVPGFEHHLASRALDGGALGIVVPHVNDVSTAIKMVDSCRYPPVGHRSMTGALPQINFESHPIDSLSTAINKATLLILMIETPQALDNVDAMAALEGVDALLIGTNDLCMEMGIPGQFDHKKINEAYDVVISACNKYGKFPGMGGVYEPALMAKYIEKGMKLILSGSDMAFMMAGAKAQVSAIRNRN